MKKLSLVLVVLSLCLISVSPAFAHGRHGYGNGGNYCRNYYVNGCERMYECYNGENCPNSQCPNYDDCSYGAYCGHRGHC